MARPNERAPLIAAGAPGGTRSAVTVQVTLELMGSPGECGAFLGDTIEPTAYDRAWAPLLSEAEWEHIFQAPLRRGSCAAECDQCPETLQFYFCICCGSRSVQRYANEVDRENHQAITADGHNNITEAIRARLSQAGFVYTIEIVVPTDGITDLRSQGAIFRITGRDSSAGNFPAAQPPMKA